MIGIPGDGHSSYVRNGRLSDPIMSLIDTGCVGQVSSIQLAALGPNTSIFNFVFQVTHTETYFIKLNRDDR